METTQITSIENNSGTERDGRTVLSSFTKANKTIIYALVVRLSPKT